MKRRKFLQASSAVSLPFFLNGIPVSAIGKNSIFNKINADSDRVLVLIQLNGGNDGLQTLLPLDQYDNLVNARPNIIIPESSAIKLDDTIGFHPSMGGMKNVWDDAKLSIVQSVGYPNQNRSHFRSADIWTTGSPADEFWTTGWLGRHFEADHSEYPEGYPNSENPDPFALTIGSFVTETCQGTVGNFSLAIQDPTNLNPLTSGGTDVVPDSNYGFELSFLRTAIAQTNAYGSIITDAAEAGNNLSTLYGDDNALAQKLKIVASLISGGLKTNVYVISLGGFDTHGDQVVDGNPALGLHATLLQTVSDAVRAFQDDLNLLGLDERVVGMTFSEFGRRIKSNDSLGTDHGSAAPLILFGSCVQPGILGDNPEIRDQVDIQEGVAMQYDFRSVYGSILMDWFELEEADVKNLLFEDFQHLPILSPCSVPTSIDPVSDEEIQAHSFPNPCNGYCTISFKSKGSRAKISVFDVLGHEIKVVSEGDFPSGEHHVKFETHDMTSGNYYFRIQTQNGQKTKAFIKG